MWMDRWIARRELMDRWIDRRERDGWIDG